MNDAIEKAMSQAAFWMANAVSNEGFISPKLKDQYVTALENLETALRTMKAAPVTDGAKDDTGDWRKTRGLYRDLQPAPEQVDVANLKRIDAYQNEHSQGWNDCIDHLAQRGLLRVKGDV